MDIERIKRKRQKSVQDQNAISKHYIFTCAKKWLEGDELHKPIEDFLHQKGLNRQNSLLVQYYDGPALYQMTYSGILITNQEKFIGFEFDLDIDETNIENVVQFGQIEIESSAHVKGTGKSFGCLSKEVLHEIRN